MSPRNMKVLEIWKVGEIGKVLANRECKKNIKNRKGRRNMEGKENKEGRMLCKVVKGLSQKFEDSFHFILRILTKLILYQKVSLSLSKLRIF
jgi:hypothetical protein